MAYHIKVIKVLSMNNFWKDRFTNALYTLRAIWYKNKKTHSLKKRR